MPAQPPIPPLLQHYLNPFRSSLTLLTNTLGASTNWLLLRFIYATLKSHHQQIHSTLDVRGSRANILPHQNEKPTRILLVSWLRNANWWKNSGRKLGLDLSKVDIVDALSTSLGLSKTSLDTTKTVRKTILEAISSSSDGPPNGANDTTGIRVLLILDGIDLLLAATDLPVLSITDMILGLREQVHSTIVTATAHGPLIQSPTTPLEDNHTTFLMGMVYQASLVMSVRELDTGVARDVSGVVRVTKGAGSWDEQTVEEDWEDREWLYVVGGDARAKVFERGA